MENMENNMDNTMSISISSFPETAIDTSIMKKNVQRCAMCNKKSLMNIECSYCHLMFCVTDRLPETHKCVSIHLSRKNNLVLSKVSTPKIDKL